MHPRPTRDTLRSLRITLQKLEQNSDADEDASAMVELKRILMNRIAELELLSALESGNPQEVDTSDNPPALPALLQMGEAAAKEPGDTSDPEKFD
jgi:hypothetical protein